MREYLIGLKRCRKETGMTQESLSAKSGISQSLICKYERLEIAPRDWTVDRLSKALDCDSRELYRCGEMDEARDAAKYLGISAEAALKLRNMGEADKAFFDGAIRGYTA